MRELKRISLAALVLIVFAGGVWVGFTFRHWLKSGPGLHVENTVTVVEQVQTLSDLVTVKYVLQKVEIMDSPPESVLGKFVQGDSRVLLLAHGIVKAGVDLKQLKAADVRISDKTISLRLPPAQITDAYLDDSQTKIIERTTGFLRSLDKDLEQVTRQNAVDDISRAARANGILNDAMERAQLELATFLHQAGFEHVVFTNGGQVDRFKSLSEELPQN